jgi:molybdopterin/thiamine biosynthesis adenylyltransferase
MSGRFSHRPPVGCDTQKQQWSSPWVELFLSPEGDLFLLPPPALAQIQIPAPFGAIVAALLQSPVADPRTLTMADPEHLAIAEASIAELARRGYFASADISESLARADPQYDRQARYFAQAGVDPHAAQRALSDSVILLLGLGGIGGAVAEGLARMGVGTIYGVEPDVVQLENLPRQPLYVPGDVGDRKSTRATARLAEIAPAMHFTAFDLTICSTGALDVLLSHTKPTLVINTADTPPGKLQRWLDAACFAADVPFITGGQRPPSVSVGPLCVPGTTPCLSCLSPGGGDDIEAQLEASRAESSFVIPAVGFADQLAAQMMIATACAFLTGTSEPALLGRRYLWNFETMDGEFELAPEQRCNKCMIAAEFREAEAA